MTAPTPWQQATSFLSRLPRLLVPPARRPVTGASLVPLLAFAAIYAGVVSWLILTDRVLFTRPIWFALMALAPWLWWLTVAGYGSLAPGRANASLIVRLCLLGLLAAGLAEPLAVRTSEGLNVVYVVDTSDSVGDETVSRALEFVVRTASEKPSKDKVGLVAFGRNAAVELPPRNTLPLEKLNAEVYGDATNIEEALQLAATLISDEDRGRIVLVTDGTSTTGRVGAALQELAAREIAVDVLPLEYEYDREVWVERLELPQFVKIGESYNASVLVNTLQPQSGTLKLVENGDVIGELPVELEPGKNRFELPLQLREPGFYDYQAIVEVDEPDGPASAAEPVNDHIAENNQALGSIFVRGQGRVMLVVDPLDDAQQWAPLKDALSEGERLVEVFESYDVPRDALAMAPYDCVIFDNVPRDVLTADQVDAVRRAVFDQGIGFLMVGGENSFGAGGWRRSPIEEVLPVSLDVSEKKVLPRGALAIVLHTCEFAAGNTWAKRITKEAIRVLSDQDEAGVIAYVADSEWVVEMQPAANYDAMVPKINAAAIGDMPAFDPAMRLGIEGLLESTASAKHMIIISDGDPQPPLPDLVQRFVDEKISVSMVAINPHQDQDIALMRQIAGTTGGRFYFPSDPRDLPAIFIKEAKTLRRNLIQTGDFQPKVAIASPMLTGLLPTPPIEGYVLTSLKPRSESLLFNEPEGDDVAGEDEVDPILTLGRYGLGSTAAYTSDLASAWNPQWISWGKYKQFVNQLVIRISRTSEQQFLRMYTHLEAGEAVITVEDFHPDEMFLDVQAKITGPRDETRQVTLRQTGPRRYQTSVPLWGKGRYLATLVGTGGQVAAKTGDEEPAGPRIERTVGGWIMPYSPEYLRFESDPIAIDRIKTETGGRLLEPQTPTEQLFDRREPKRTTRPIFDWLLACLACLLPLDVAMRRVQLDWGTIRDFFRPSRRAESLRTTEALLTRATESRATSASSAAATLAATRRESTASTNAAAARKLADAAKQKKAEQAKPAEEPQAGSTASRLLDLKRKRGDS